MTGMRTDIQKKERIQHLAKQILDASFELSILVGEVTVSTDIVIEAMKNTFRGISVQNVLDRYRPITQKQGRFKGDQERESTIRHAARYLFNQFSNMSMEKIGDITGSIDHSSVSRSIKKAKDLIDSDENFRKKIDNCRTLIRKYYYERNQVSG